MSDASKTLAAKAPSEGGGAGLSAEVLAAAERARAKAQAQRAAQQDARAEDQRLVELTRQGDARAFKRLVERNQGRLFAVAYGMLRDRDDAMDAVQDTFIKAHRKLDDFEGNSAFSTWLYRICVNLCIDKQRSVARRRQVDLEGVRPAEFGEDAIYAGADIAPKLSAANPLKAVSDKQLGAAIGTALDQLSEDHRRVLVLREVDGLSYEDIADVLSIPRGTVMSRLFHARKNMQRLLQPHLDASGMQIPGSPPGEETP